MSKKESFEQTAIRVSGVSVLGNIILSLVKLLAGFLANSSAMISDAIHSASDVFSSLIVIIGVRMAAKESDEEHPYGHERFEPVAAIVLAVVLAVTGLFIGHVAIEKLTSGEYESIKIPGVLAIVVAVLSIVCKEAMYWYTRHFAKKIDSSALMADAWHHRSDALSSIGALIGIIGARMGFAWFDPMASLIICVFILKAAYDIFVSAIQKLVDKSCDKKTQIEIENCVNEHPDVRGVEKLQTREFGNKIYVDVEILVDGDLTIRRGNEISSEVHDAIESKFQSIKHIAVAVKAYEESELKWK